MSVQLGINSVLRVHEISRDGSPGVSSHLPPNSKDCAAVLFASSDNRCALFFPPVFSRLSRTRFLQYFLGNSDVFGLIVCHQTIVGRISTGAFKETCFVWLQRMLVGFFTSNRECFQTSYPAKLHQNATMCQDD